MSFVNPWFLLALSAVAIPVIIHLFSFRRFRKVLFSNIGFLSELKEEKKKQSRLKNLLVLLARILALIFLVLAFSRPYLPYEDAEISHEGNVVSVYIDNSFSMEALSGKGRLIDVAKNTGNEIAETFQATDDFHLVTNDFEGSHQRLVSREDFNSLLEEVELSPVVRKLSQVLQRQENILKNIDSKNKKVFIVSDFQKNISDFDNFETDTTLSTYFVPIKAQQADNVYIDSLWFESPIKLIDKPIDVNIRISNDGQQVLENQPLRLYINGALRSVANFDIQPGEKKKKQISFKISNTGVQQGKVEIIDHPVVFDDKMYFSFRINENIPILAVNQDNESRYLNALFKDEETFRFRNMTLLNIDYSAFNLSNIIVLNGLNSISSGLQMELTRFVKDGGSLVVFPGKDIDFNSYHEFLTSMQINHYESLDTTTYNVSSINDTHRLYHGVFDETPDDADLPTAYQHYKISHTTTATEDYLLQLQNGASFFTSQPYGSGTIYLSAVPLSEDYSNFPAHQIFVPTLYNAALHSLPHQKPYQIIGKNQPVSLKRKQSTSDHVYQIKGEGLEVIPETRIVSNRIYLYTHGQIDKAGNYLIYNNDDIIESTSFNYDRRESELDVYDAGELEGLIDDHQMKRVNALNVSDISFDTAFEKHTMGRELWQLCLILALMFFLIEILLLRLWK